MANELVPPTSMSPAKPGGLPVGAGTPVPPLVKPMAPPAVERPPAAPVPPASKAPVQRFRPGAPAVAPASGGATEEPKGKEPGKFFREYYGAAFLFLIAIFIGAAYFFLNPLITEFKVTNQEITTQSQILTDERAFLDTLNQSIAAAEAIPPDVLMKVNEALPRSIQIPKLLQNMSRIALARKVGLSSVQFSEPPSAPQTDAAVRAAIALQPIEIAMKVDAPDYATMRGYLEDIEQNLRVLDIRTISVTANEQTGELTYDIKVVAYSISGEARAMPPIGSAAAAAVPSGANLGEALGGVR